MIIGGQAARISPQQAARLSYNSPPNCYCTYSHGLFHFEESPDYDANLPINRSIKCTEAVPIQMIWDSLCKFLLLYLLNKLGVGSNLRAMPANLNPLPPFIEKIHFVVIEVAFYAASMTTSFKIHCLNKLRGKVTVSGQFHIRNRANDARGFFAACQ